MSGEDLHDSGHGIGSIENARWSTHDLDAFDVVQCEQAEIERATRIIERDAVDEHLRVIALAAAREERRRRAIRAGLHDRHPGHLP